MRSKRRHSVSPRERFKDAASLSQTWILLLRHALGHAEFNLTERVDNLG